MPVQDRRLAAILFTDIVGYTAMMQRDEAYAVSVIKHYNEALAKAVTTHRGEILNNYGDGSLCAFTSALDAVNCALELQASLRSEPQVPLRIGLHIGEIFFEDGKVLGDGVNLASRIQSLSVANSILLSAEIRQVIRNQSELRIVSLGRFRFKNVEEEVEVFALNNNGLVIPVKTSSEGKLQGNKSLRKWVIGALALLAAVIAGYLLYLQKSDESNAFDRSVAVLPFVNMTNDPDREYFSDGLTEELLNVLTKVSDLKVTARTSSFAFKGKNEDVRIIANKLGVANVLEGSVRQSGDKIRITAQLIRAIDGTHLWSETYERKMEDIFQVQDDIANAILQTLKASLLPASTTRTSKTNPEVSNMILKGNFFYERRDKESLMKAFKLYQQALTIDSTDARVWAALAKNCIPLSIYEGDGKLDESKSYVTRALALDSNLAEVHRVLGFLRGFQHDHAGAIKEFKKALDLQPGNADVLRNLGTEMGAFGKMEESIEYKRQALDLDPMKPVNHSALIDALIFAGRYSEAIAAIGNLQEIQPNYPRIYVALAEAYLLQGAPEKTLAEVERIGDPIEKDFFRTLAYFSLGQEKEWMKALNSVVNASKGGYWAGLAELYAFLGRKDEAFNCLDKAFLTNDDLLATIKVDPLLKNLRSDPRFKVMLEKLNLPVD